jgi:hypothetical protein
VSIDSLFDMNIHGNIDNAERINDHGAGRMLAAAAGNI